MANMKQRELDMIVDVAKPGEPLDSSMIAERIKEKYGRDFTTREIGLAISWSLNTTFEKERDSQRRYVFTKMGRPV